MLITLIFAGSLGLRLWSIDHGLPFVYNPDEAAHFVPRAVGFLLTDDLNPDYLTNPPLVTYLFWLVFGAWFGGGSGIANTIAADPPAPYLVARVVVAVIGAIGSISMYLVGKRMFDQRVALVAALLMAVAFLPVHWSHFATNDVAAMVAASVSLLGTAWILKKGGITGYLVAGAGLGLACGAKYTAGIMLLPLLTAAFFQWRDDRRRATLGLVTAGAVSVVTFLLAVPPLLFDTQNALVDLASLVPGERAPKIGQAQDHGYFFYPWALSWGWGWLACVAAIWGAARLLRHNRRVALLLVPAPMVYIAFMGAQSGFYGRLLLPIFPLLILLAAFGVVDAAAIVAGRLGWGPLPTVLALTVLVSAQSLIHVIHMNVALGRTDTRAQAFEWMQANVPPGEGFVNQGVLVAPMLDLDQDTGGIQNHWEIIEQRSGEAVYPIPKWLDDFESQGVCWVSASSLYYDRVLLDQHLVERSAEYYRQLESRGEVVFRASPYRTGAEPVPFNFDLSTNLYPLNFERPGGEVVIYRLRGGACA